jgi:hypothetical protein
MCRECGGDIVIGAGAHGYYHAKVDYEDLDRFFEAHSPDKCPGGINCSDDARMHFCITDDGGETMAKTIWDFVDAIKHFERRPIPETEPVYILSKKELDNLVMEHLGVYLDAEGGKNDD